MRESQATKHPPFFDIATLIIVIAAVLYFFGVSYINGKISGLGISSSLISYDIYYAISAGFVDIFVSFISNPLGSLLAAIIFIVSFVLFNRKKISKTIFLIGVSLVVFVHGFVSFYSGLDISEMIEKEISLYSNNNNTKVNFTKKITINFLDSEDKSVLISGLMLENPGDFVFVANVNGIHAVQKTRIIKIIFLK